MPSVPQITKAPTASRFQALMPPKLGKCPACKSGIARSASPALAMEQKTNAARIDPAITKVGVNRRPADCHRAGILGIVSRPYQFVPKFTKSECKGCRQKYQPGHPQQCGSRLSNVTTSLMSGRAAVKACQIVKVGSVIGLFAGCQP